MDKRTERYNTILKDNLSKLDRINRHFESFKHFWSANEYDACIEINDKLMVEHLLDGEVVHEGKTIGEVLAFIEGIAYARDLMLDTIENIDKTWTTENKKKLFESLSKDGCWPKDV
jgi:hypothetical protein